MNSKTYKYNFIAVIIFFLFLAGLVHIFLLRFNIGDIYPEYSSLRSDPMGTKVLYESISKYSKSYVSRNYLDIEKGVLNHNATLLFLSDPINFSYPIPKRIVAQINYFIRDGGRLVITLHPKNYLRDNNDKKEQNKKNNKKTLKNDNMIMANWLNIDIDQSFLQPNANAILSSNILNSPLPLFISCHTSIFFTEPDNKTEHENKSVIKTDNKKRWQTIYERDGKPVIIECKMGKGAIVLSALSYFISNKAMKSNRYPALLSWLIGNHKYIIFDEYHHGISSKHGVATLMRKYRMHWLIAGLLILAGLFIWKNSIGIIPHGYIQHTSDNNIATGKDSTSALINLLRRNIPSKTILNSCILEFKKSITSENPDIKEKLIHMQTMIKQERNKSFKNRNYVQTYNKLVHILNNKPRLCSW